MAQTKRCRTVFYGDAVHALSKDDLEFMRSALIGVDLDGKIKFIEKNTRKEYIDHILTEQGWQGVDVCNLRKGEFLIPGFVDTHTHACQYPNTGYGLQYELMEWLEKVTFPTERQFADVEYATRTYTSVVSRVIASGTTTAVYYASVHLPATKALAKICHKMGQRAFIGNSCMDRNGASDGSYPNMSMETTIQNTKDLIQYIAEECANDPITGEKVSHSLVHPIITPRFAICCTDAFLTALSDIYEVDPSNLMIQTHLSENPEEVKFTKTLFPFAESYAHIYDHFKLLTTRTILAHCVHLEDKEVKLIAERGSGISHCPTSNLNLRSGICNVQKLWDQDIKVGLGTDVSGGASVGMLTAMRDASSVSKVLAFQERDRSENSELVTYHSLGRLIHMATLGGAQVCCLEDKIGNFEVGKEFDALLIQTGQSESVEYGSNKPSCEGYQPGTNPGLYVNDEDSLEVLVEKFVFCGDDRNIGSVFVKGRCIGGSQPMRVDY